MLRRAKRAVKDARVTAKARATIETRDEAYARVPLRIDLDDARDDDDDGDGALDDRASPRVVAHYGFDATTSAVSYARDQHALFAASEHGVKAFGARGLECLYATTRGGSSEATRAAYVGPSRVYRCGRDGDVEVWDGRERRSLASENLEAGDDDDEPSCASEAMRGTNFFVTGTANGDVCVHALGVNARGETTLARRGVQGVGVAGVVARFADAKRRGGGARATGKRRASDAAHRVVGRGARAVALARTTVGGGDVASRRSRGRGGDGRVFDVRGVARRRLRRRGIQRRARESLESARGHGDDGGNR